MVRALLRLPLALAVSFLPSRWRDRFAPGESLGGAGALSGFLESIAAITLGAWAFERYYAGQSRAAAVDTASAFVLGATVYLGSFFTLPGILAAYHFAEGLVRALSAIAHHEALGAAAPWLAERALAGVRRLTTRPEQFPDDTLTPDGASLLVDSARSLDWDSATTIEHNSVLYSLAGVEPSPDPTRPHRYRLTRQLDTAVLRRVVRI